MLKAYTPATYRTVIEYELAFDDGLNNGFGFPCDRDGKLLESEDQNPEAHENLKFCLAHPEKFDRFNEVVEYRRRIREDARGICSCGEDLELWDQYYGTCQCPNCGRWYNLFGQELLPPDCWEEDPSEEEYCEEW